MHGSQALYNMYVCKPRSAKRARNSGLRVIQTAFLAPNTSLRLGSIATISRNGTLQMQGLALHVRSDGRTVMLPQDQFQSRVGSTYGRAEPSAAGLGSGAVWQGGSKLDHWSVNRRRARPVDE